MARRIPDLEPADYNARIHLRAHLRALRERTGVSQRDFAPRLGLEQGSLSKMERTGVDQSKTSTVARWARALDHRLTLTPIGFPEPVRWRRQSNSNDLLNALVTTGNIGALGGADGWVAAYALHKLVGIRLACGVSQDQLSRILGISEQAISLTERGASDNQLAWLQRYARGVARASQHRSGYLALALDPTGADQPERANPPVDI
jgi:DNA-binding XRE family transcriptional regulator